MMKKSSTKNSYRDPSAPIRSQAVETIESLSSNPVRELVNRYYVNSYSNRLRLSSEQVVDDAISSCLKFKY